MDPIITNGPNPEAGMREQEAPTFPYFPPPPPAADARSPAPAPQIQ